VVAELRHQGWQLPESQANFVWLPLGADTVAFATAADKAGLVVRAFPGEGARCTIAEAHANDLLLHVARDFVVARTF
jgi:histidinol-phosphate aminotransferase